MFRGLAKSDPWVDQNIFLSDAVTYRKRGALFKKGLHLINHIVVRRTMQHAPTYDDVVDEVKSFLEERTTFAVRHGIAEENILIDPGIGFGKTAEHNVRLIQHLGDFSTLGRPI